MLFHSITDFLDGNDLAFDVALHVGTLVAVLAYFRRDVLALLRGWWRTVRGQPDADGRLAWWIAAATVPAAGLGFVFESTIESVFRDPMVVAVVLVLGGGLLWLADRYGAQRIELGQTTGGMALAIGLGQAMALIPGVSRSGATIMIARWFGMTRPAAARFSFLLSIPIIAGAGVKQGLDLNWDGVQPAPFIVGMVAAAVVGWLAIGWLLRLVQRHSYAVFAWYRFVLGAVAFFYFWVR